MNSRLLQATVLAAVGCTPDLSGTWIGVLTDETDPEWELEWELVAFPLSVDGTDAYEVSGGIPELDLDYDDAEVSSDVYVCTARRCDFVDGTWPAWPTLYGFTVDEARRGSLRHHVTFDWVPSSFGANTVVTGLAVAAEPGRDPDHYSGSFVILREGLVLSGTAELERQ